MHLFGGKFCTYIQSDGTKKYCTCDDILNPKLKCVCNRKHFDNILWATITVFQVCRKFKTNIAYRSQQAFFD
jgi:hypothetical protein